MRSSRPQNFLRRSVLKKFKKNLAAKDALDSGCKLSVGKSSGAALSELNVGIFIENSCFEKGCNILCTSFNIVSSFKNKRTQSCPCKGQRRKNSGRPESDYHRAKR